MCGAWAGAGLQRSSEREVSCPPRGSDHARPTRPLPRYASRPRLPLVPPPPPLGAPCDVHEDMTVLRRSPLTLLRRSYHHTPARAAKLTVGIRREDPARIWERRCPLTPDVVHELVEKDGVEVLVQPCDRRVFTSNDFLKARFTLVSVNASSSLRAIGWSEATSNSPTRTCHSRHKGDAPPRSAH